MSIFEKIFFSINTTSRDIKETFSPLLLGLGYELNMFFENSERHVVYTQGDIEFDFLWENGQRPALFLKRNGEYLKTDVYQKIVDKYAPKNFSVGQTSFYINSKMSKDKYYDEHLLFVTEYIKSI